MDPSIFIGVGAVGALVLASVALTVGWVMCLIHAAQEERWAWFVVMLLFGAAAFLYFFIHFEWPSDRDARLASEARETRYRDQDRRELDDLRSENRELRRRLAQGT